MKKHKNSLRKYGYRLCLNRSGNKGRDNWEMVGFVFPSSYEANEYRKSKYPDTQKWTITGVRVNMEPVGAE